MFNTTPTQLMREALRLVAITARKQFTHIRPPLPTTRKYLIQLCELRRRGENENVQISTRQQ